jgi:hypothetical protein
MLDHIERARARISGLYIDTEQENFREIRRVTSAENRAMETLLEEIHRLHGAVSTQRAEIAQLLGDAAAHKAHGKK